MKPVRTHRLALAAAGVLALTGCTGEASGDKAGGPGGSVVLRLATIDEVNNNGQSYGPQAFVDSLLSVSGGRLTVDVTTTYGDGAADAESKLVEAIASGEVDGGWPATRAFADAGISGLEAVEAPMTITSYAAEKALVSGPTAEALLARLDGTGVVGLGLAVGPLRRPFAAEAPLVGSADWQGVGFRVYNSPVQADAVRALGATPVNVGLGWHDEVVAGTLRGGEFDVAQYWKSGFAAGAGNVTANVVLWPKLFVFSISQKRFDALTDQQRNWVRQAAEQAVEASVDATYDETTPARQLCDKGARFVDASPEQITALRAALAPVIERLAADPTAGPLLAQIQAIAAQHPGPDQPAVPDSCRQATASQAGQGQVPETVSSLPDGVYRVQISLADIEAAGLSNGPGWTGIWTVEIEDGTYQLTCRALANPGRDCGNDTYDGALEAGHLRGTGTTVYFVASTELMADLTECRLPASVSLAGHCGPPLDHQMNWKLDGDLLRFSDYRPADERQPDEVEWMWVVKAWRKIA